MGRCKQLLPLRGKPAIRHCLESLLRGGATQVLVVLGAYGEQIATAAKGPGVTLLSNRDRAGDMASSIRAGIAALPPAAPAALICLSDMPLVAPQTIAALLAAHRRTHGSIILPRHGSRRGHPVLIPREILKDLDAQMTLRDLMHRHAQQTETVDMADPGTTLDMDTPADYDRLRALCETEPSAG